MLCFVISKRDYDLSVKNRLEVEFNYVCIGSVVSIEEAKVIANNFPCITEVRTISDTDKCCYIVCNI